MLAFPHYCEVSEDPHATSYCSVVDESIPYGQLLSLSRRPQEIVIWAFPCCFRAESTAYRSRNEDFLFHTLGISLQHDFVVLARVTEESSHVTACADGF